jgi:adenine-specific DNA-methyltransferase
LPQYFDRHAIPCTYAPQETWTLCQQQRAIKHKVEAQGTPLKDWDIDINRGILTGYNPAFFVTADQRQEILNNCQTEDERQRTEKIIRPMLRGKDIRAYGCEWKGLYS